MDHTTTIALRAYNEHAVLARILLVFSRRRLAIRSLSMETDDVDAPASLRIEAQCPDAAAEKVVNQLRRIVEVVDARVDAVPAVLSAPVEPLAASA